MCDYSADGVWDREGRAGLLPELPITVALMCRISQWQATYDETDFYSSRAQGWNDADLRRHSNEGLAIAIEVKRQLQDWTVIYHDESRMPPRPSDKELWAIRAPSGSAYRVFIEHHRPWFEYEITDDVVLSGRPPDNPVSRLP